MLHLYSQTGYFLQVVDYGVHKLWDYNNAGVMYQNLIKSLTTRVTVVSICLYGLHSVDLIIHRVLK